MKIAVILGSYSDFDVMKKCMDTLHEFGVDFEISVISAHRALESLQGYIKAIEQNDIELVIAAAGKAAHLPGVIAAMTILPVIGVPMKSSATDGLDSFLSIVQMPSGIPVATVAINGSENAALLGIEILSLKYDVLKTRLLRFREKLRKDVEDMDAKIKEEAKFLWKK